MAMPALRPDLLPFFEGLLRRCKTLPLGRCLHALILESEYSQNGLLSNLLVQMYGKCQALNDAQALMSMMKHRDVYTWTFIIGAFAELGQSRNALLMYEDMQRDGVKPNECTFVYLLSSCDDKAALEEDVEVLMMLGMWPIALM